MFYLYVMTFVIQMTYFFLEIYMKERIPPVYTIEMEWRTADFLMNVFLDKSS